MVSLLLLQPISVAAAETVAHAEHKTASIIVGTLTRQDFITSSCDVTPCEEDVIDMSSLFESDLVDVKTLAGPSLPTTLVVRYFSHGRWVGKPRFAYIASPLDGGKYYGRLWASIEHGKTCFPDGQLAEFGLLQAATVSSSYEGYSCFNVAS